MGRSAEMGAHSGHRDRLKRQFLDHGLDAMADHQVLELLLFYAIPRADTNPIAHALMDRFGSLHAVLEAAPQALMEVPGLGEHAATLVHLIIPLVRRYEMDKVADVTILNTTELLGRYMVPRFFGRTDEAVCVAYLDSKCKIIHQEIIAEGSVNSVHFSVRRVAETALLRKATCVVIAHNHPSGSYIPGGDDVRTTENLLGALSAVGVRLIDHIVVGGNDYLSMRDDGQLRRFEHNLGIFQDGERQEAKEE